MFYFVIYILLVICALKYVNVSKINHNFKNCVSLVFVIFVLVAGLRYEIGVDYFNYQSYFESAEPIGKLFSANSSFAKNIFSGWEPGCIILISFLRTFFSDSQILFFVSSIICSILLFKSLRFFCEPRFLFFSLLIYFSFVYMYQEMHALRQAVGACIFYYGITKYPFKWKVLFYTILSGCFHYSLWLFVPIVLFLDRPIKILYQKYILFFSFIIFLLRIPWMYGTIDILSSILPNAGFILRLVGYTTKDQLVRPFFFTFLFYLIPYLYLLYCINRGKYIVDTKTQIVQNLYLLYLCFTMIFWEFAFFSIRYGWICLFGMAVILPKMIPIFQKRKTLIIYIILFCFIPIRTFMFPDITTTQFSPYENYISRVIFKEEGTGRERVIRYLNQFGKSLNN